MKGTSLHRSHLHAVLSEHTRLDVFFGDQVLVPEVFVSNSETSEGKNPAFFKALTVSSTKLWFG
jgi:hypothetical protein